MIPRPDAPEPDRPTIRRVTVIAECDDGVLGVYTYEPEPGSVIGIEPNVKARQDDRDRDKPWHDPIRDLRSLSMPAPWRVAFDLTNVGTWRHWIGTRNQDLTAPWTVALNGLPLAEPEPSTR